MTLSERFGRYKLLSKIADGGMAEVYVAVVGGVGGFQKRVALKKILPHFTRDDSFVRSFVNEAHICSQLHHPNLVQVYEFNWVEDSLCLAMEFIEGLDLERIISHRYLKRERIPPTIAVEITLQMLDGLEYAHTAQDLDDRPLNVVHRDLKPSNVLIDRSGLIKIVDFGVAKASINRYKTINQGTAKGTVSYMSPEQASGRMDLGPASDLFSVGAILYEMLSLRRLFDGDNLFVILDEVRTTPIEPKLARLRDVPQALIDVLTRALTRDLAGRYESAAQMARELRAVYPDLPGQPLLVRFVEQMQAEGLDIPGVGTGAEVTPAEPLEEYAPERATVPLGERSPGSGTRPGGGLPPPRALEAENAEATEWTERSAQGSRQSPGAASLFESTEVTPVVRQGGAGGTAGQGSQPSGSSSGIRLPGPGPASRTGASVVSLKDPGPSPQSSGRGFDDVRTDAAIRLPPSNGSGRSSQSLGPVGGQNDPGYDVFEATAVQADAPREQAAARGQAASGVIETHEGPSSAPQRPGRMAFSPEVTASRVPFVLEQANRTAANAGARGQNGTTGQNRTVPWAPPPREPGAGRAGAMLTEPPGRAPTPAEAPAAAPNMAASSVPAPSSMASASSMVTPSGAPAPSNQFGPSSLPGAPSFVPPSTMSPDPMRSLPPREASLRQEPGSDSSILRVPPAERTGSGAPPRPVAPAAPPAAPAMEPPAARSARPAYEMNASSPPSQPSLPPQSQPVSNPQVESLLNLPPAWSGSEQKRPFGAQLESVNPAPAAPARPVTARKSRVWPLVIGAVVLVLVGAFAAAAFSALGLKLPGAGLLTPQAPVKVHIEVQDLPPNTSVVFLGDPKPQPLGDGVYEVELKAPTSYEVQVVGPRFESVVVPLRIDPAEKHLWKIQAPRRKK